MMDLKIFFRNIFSISKVKIVGKNNFVQKGRISNSYFRVIGKNNNIYIGENSLLRKAKVTIKGNNNQIIFEENCYTRNMRFKFKANNSKFRIGKGTTIEGIRIIMEDGEINIGDNCMFSYDIELRNTDSHKIYDGVTNEIVNKNRDIKIKDRVWIGTRVLILKGSEIGEDSIIGAGSIVNKRIKEKVIAAGNPVKIVKENVRWER